MKKIYIMIVLITLLSITLFSCENTTGSKDNVSDKNDKVIDEDETIVEIKDLIKLTSNINGEYVFEYTENNNDFKTESAIIEYFERGKENTPYKLLGYEGIESINKEMKFKIRNQSNGKFEIDCNGASMEKTTPYNEEYKEYIIFDKNEISVLDNEEIIAGAILFSKENVEFNEKNILLNKDLLSTELNKFDFGFILKVKLSTRKFTGN